MICATFFSAARIGQTRPIDVIYNASRGFIRSALRVKNALRKPIVGE